MKNSLKNESDYSNALIKTAQYLATLIKYQNFWIFIKKIINEYYKVDFFYFYKPNYNGKSFKLQKNFSNDQFSEKIFEQIKEFLAQVMDSGFIASELINIPESYAIILLPVRKMKKIMGIMVIGHQRNELLPKFLLNNYLSLARLVGTTIDNLYMNEELKNYQNHLEELVKQRTRELKESEKRYREAYNRADFYKSLFAHDMRNILNGIQAPLSLIPYIIKDIKDSDKLNRTLKSIKKYVFKGVDLINNIRKLSDIEIIEDLKKIEVISILHMAIDFASSFASKDYIKKNVNIKSENNLENFYIAANDLLLDIFDNILINAINHNRNEQIDIMIKLSILNEEERRLIKLEFIDNGIGIPNQLKENILKGEYEKRKGSTGMGIGLIIIQTLTRTFDGSLYIEERIKGDYTKGTNFILVFPEYK